MTLVDTNILIDVIDVQAGRACHPQAQWSVKQYALAVDAASAAIDQTIYGELAPNFGDETDLRQAVPVTLVRYLDVPYRAAWLAAGAHAVYRSRGGVKTSTLSDFLIGGHAQAEGHEILTRDPRRFRTYFPSVPLITP